VWFLPKDWTATEAALPPGKYLIPWYYTDGDIDRLLTLLQQILPNVEYVLRLESTILEQLTSGPLTNLDRSIVLLDIPRDAVDTATLETLQDCLPARYLLVRISASQEEGYGWQEKHIKPLLMSLLKRYVTREDNPLRSLGIDKLPIFPAASLTSDPMELLELVQKAMYHRFSNAAVGLDEADYKRSLDRVAGEHLARRLSVLETGPLQSALEIILSESKGPAEPEAFDLGASALAEIGLAVKIGDDVSLGPLARRAVEQTMRAAFVDALPKTAWNDATREYLRRLDRENKQLAHEPLPALDFPEPPSWPGIRDVELPNDFDQAPLIEKASILANAVASPLGELPSDALMTKANTVLRELRRAESDASASKSRQIRTWIQVLLFLTANGRDRLENQEDALNALASLASDEEIDKLRPILQLALVWSLLNSLQGAETVQKAEALLFETQASCEQTKRDCLLGFVLLFKGRIARAAGKRDEAGHYLRESVEALERLADKNDSTAVTSVSVKKGLMHVFVDLGTLYLDANDDEQASQWFPRAQELVEDFSDDWDKATVYLHLGRWKQSQGELDAAVDWYRKCLPIEEDFGDSPRLVILYRQLGNVARSGKKFETAANWYMKSLSVAENLGNVSTKALIHMELGILNRMRGDIDHAARWYMTALREYEKLGFPAGQAIAFSSLGVLYFSSADHFDKAIPYLRQSADLYADLGKAKDEQDMRTVLAAALHGIGHNREAKAEIEDVIQAGNESPVAIQLCEDIEESIRKGNR
jgi:tetratricopeptide (TPR) repeat protein